MDYPFVVFFNQRSFIHLLTGCLLLPVIAATLSHSFPAIAQPSTPTCSLADLRLIASHGHRSGVRSAVFSPDGQFVATKTVNGVHHIWDANTGEEIYRFESSLSSSSSSLSVPLFSPDSRYLAIEKGGGAWGSTCLHPLRGGGSHALKGRPIKFSPDGSQIITSVRGGAQLWDSKTGTEGVRIGHSDFSDAAFSKDGKQIATIGRDTFVRVWSAATGQPIDQLGEDIYAGSISFSRSGKWFVVGQGALHSLLLDRSTGEEVARFEGGQPVLFAGERRLLTVSQGQMGAAYIWAVDTGEQIFQFKPLRQTRLDGASVSPDGQHIVTTEARTARLWSATTGKELHRLDGHDGGVQFVQFSPDGQRVITASWDGTARIWSVRTGKEILRLGDGFSVDVATIAVSSDGRYAASGGVDSTIQVWSLETGQPLRQTRTSGWVLGLSFSPDGQRFAAASSDGFLHVWSVSDGRKLIAIEGHRGEATDVAFSPDGQQLVSAGADGVARLWSLESSEQLRVFSANNRASGHYLPSASSNNRISSGYTLYSASFSPDGTRILTTDNRSTARVWSIASGKELFSLQAPRSRRGPRSKHIHDASYSPDGLRIVTAEGSRFGYGIVRIWDASFDENDRSRESSRHPFSSVPDRMGRHLGSGARPVESSRELFAMEHDGPIASATFSSGGTQILTASVDGTTRIWSAASGNEVLRLAGHQGPVTDAVFLPNPQHALKAGRFALTAGKDGSLRVWSLRTGDDVGSLVSFSDGSWVVTTGDGRFDAGDLERIRGVHWAAKHELTEPIPVEAFMRDYYEPRLLPRILAGETFPEIKGLLERNRVQPSVAVTDVTIAPDGTASVTVAATSVQRAYGGETRTSEVHDVRLFRNGQLVAWTDGTVATGTETATLRYEGIALLTTGADSVTFSAYAFNDDRVKSRTAYRGVPLPSRPERPRRAYVISFGVDRFANADWNLRFAANDAWQYQSVVTGGLEASGTFAELVAVPLVAAATPGRSTDARKQTLKAVFDLLAGRPVPASLRARIPQADRLRKATPDDLVIITASTHGYTDGSGAFYLLPTDIPPGAGTRITPALLDAAVSSDDLTDWLRSVDAGDLIMIVDACHAAAAVEGTDFKPGPMGSRGLGQLAFNKGMRILTATQSADVALEVNQLKQGLLSYALVADGLQQHAADRAPGDGRITAGEWLSYGAERVPELHRLIDSRSPISADRGHVAVIGRGIQTAREDDRYQRPALFDFRKLDRDVVLTQTPAASE